MHNVPSPQNDDTSIEHQIQAKGLTGPRVLPEQILNLLNRVVFKVDVPAGTTTTFVHAFLDNKFHLATGHSACVDPANFNAEIGMNIAKASAEAKAKDKLWELEGYALFKQLNPPASTLFERVKAEHAELVERLNKLTTFTKILTFTLLAHEDQGLLLEQRAVMTDYAEVLHKRIQRFEGAQQ